VTDGLQKPVRDREPSADAASRDRAPAARQSHGPDCACTRCRGFEPGNDLGLRHGSYASPVRLGEEVEQLAAEIAPLVPAYRDSDGPLVQLLALVFRRIARAEPAISEAEERGDLEVTKALRSDQRGWANTATRILADLGMSPVARARLGLDVAMTHRALTATELHAAAALEGEATEEPAP
jgi:hypothetical protein